MTEFVLWYIAVELLGLAALPLAMAALPRLADRGYGLAKVLGVLLVTFCNYLLGSILKLGNNAPLLVLCMLLLCASGLFALRDERADVRRWLREHRTVILAQEALFLAIFAVWAMVRAAHPGVLSTEKPMDLALMTATHKATAFPPYDPWLSGTSINYYYGGYLAIGTMVTLTGVAPTVGYNLGVALVFALVGVSACAVIYSLTRSVRWSLLAPVFVLLVGNLDGLWQLKNPAIGSANFNFFNSSRIITAGYNIDEFPAFSFLLGDLHPHVIGLPFTILAIGVALNLALAAQAGWRALAPDDLRGAITLLLAGLVVGALYFINSWDWPSYLMLTVAALLLPGLARLSGRLLGEGLGLGLAVVALSYLLYLEYRHDFQPQYSSVGVRFHGSPTDQVLTMFGLFLVPVAVFIFGMFWQRAAAGAPADDLAPYDRAHRLNAAMATAGAATARSAASTTLPARRATRPGAATVVLDREPALPTTPPCLDDDRYDQDDNGADEDDEHLEDEAPWDSDLPRLPMPSLRSRRRRNGKGKGQTQKTRRGRASISASAVDTVSSQPINGIVQGRDDDGARAREDADGHDAADIGDDEDTDLPRLPVPSFMAMARNKRQRTERDGRRGRADSGGRGPGLRPNGGAIVLAASALLLWGLLSLSGTFGTMGLLLPFMVAALYLAWREGRAARPINAFALLLCAGGIALIIACDSIYLRDNFCGPTDSSGACTGDMYRMNTVFKLYYQAWTLLALGAVYGLWMLWTRLRGSIARFLAPGGAMAVIAAGGVYTVLGLFTPTTNVYTNPAAFTEPTAAATLDGAAYLRHYVHQPLTAADAAPASAAEIDAANHVANAIPADAAAIDWINHNVHGHPTLLEADVAIGAPGVGADPLAIQSGPEDYWPFPGSTAQGLLMYRVSTFTGLADVLGSGGSHEGLWHGGQAATNPYYDVTTRFNDVRTMYTSGDPTVVGGLLRHYGVDYIYLGGAELYAYYNGHTEAERAAVARFQRLGYGVRYSVGGVTILSTTHPAG